MILYFADRRFRILGLAGTNGKGLTVYNDLKTEEIGAGGINFKCYIGFDSESRGEVENYTKPGNYLLRQNGNVSEFYTIIESETDTKNQEVYLYAEEAGLDLLNEIALPYEADQAYPIAYYINLFAADSGFEVRTNQIANLSRKLKWEGESTVTARLLSVATQFDHADISFSFKVEGLTVVKKYIDVYKKRGRNNYVALRLNRDIDRIKTKKSIANLATALYVTGGTPEGAEEPVTLNGYAYDDGRFHLQGPWLKDRQANAVWSRYLSKLEEGTGTGHLMATFSYDTTNQQELLNRAISRLKELSQVEINYEVDISRLPDTVQIGDKVSIVDGPGKQYLSARVLKLESSASNGTAKATLGEYLIQSGGISQSVQSLAKRFEYLEKIKTRYTWTAYADDTTGAGISLDPTGKTCFGTANNRTQKEPDLTDPNVYTWVKFRGEDGYTQYLHIKYSDDGGSTFTADNGNTPGKWLGQYVDYYEPDSDDVTVYTWKKIQGEDGEKGDQGEKGEDGMDAVMYKVQATTAAARKETDGSVTPRSVNFKFYKNNGDGNYTEFNPPDMGFHGEISQAVGSGGTLTWTTAVENAGNGYLFLFPNNVDFIRCTLHDTNDFVVAETTIPIVSDGKDGQDALTYRLRINAASVVMDEGSGGRFFTPSALQISGFSQTGSGEPVPYEARFVVGYYYKSWNQLYEVTAETFSYNIPADNGELGALVTIEVSMYDKTTGTLLDRTEIPVTPKGTDGADGAKGDKGDKGDQGDPGADGQDATAYKMLVNASAVAKTASGSYKQTSITLQGRSQSGSGAFGGYACRFKIETTTSSNLASASWTSRYTSGSNVTSYTYTLPSGITGIRCSMYLAGGTSTLLDQIIIPVIQEGSTTRSPGIFYSSKSGSSWTTSFNYEDVSIPTGTTPQKGDLIICSNSELFAVNSAGSAITVKYLMTFSVSDSKQDIGRVFYSSKSGSSATTRFEYEEIKMTGVSPEVDDIIICSNGTVFTINSAGSAIEVEYLKTLSVSGVFYSSKSGSSGTTSFNYEEVNITGTTPQKGDLIICSNGELFAVNSMGSTIDVKHLTTI